MDKRRKRGNATRARILRTARREFARYGFAGVSMNQLAKRAGVSKSLIYQHFGSKADLYRSVINSAYAELSSRETVKTFPADGTVNKLLKSIFQDLFDFNAKNPTFVRLVAWENLNGARWLDPEKARAARQPGLNKLKNLIENAKQRGLVRPDLDVDKFVYLMQAITFVYFSNKHTMKLLTGIDFDSPQTRNDFINFYATVLTEGISSKEGETKG